MKKEEQLIEVLKNFEDKVFTGKYHQVNIDLIQDTRSEFDDLLEDQPVNDGEIRDFIGSFHYRVENLIEICKEGPDKEFLEELEKEISKLK